MPSCNPSVDSRPSDQAARPPPGCTYHTSKGRASSPVPPHLGRHQNHSYLEPKKMRHSAAAALLLLAPIATFADRYGIDEAMSEGGALPGWLLPLAFIALVVYHLHDHSKLDGQRARESYEHEQTSKRLSEARRDLTVTKQELADVKYRYSALQSGVHKYLEGLTTDEEFSAAVEPYLDPIA